MHDVEIRVFPDARVAVIEHRGDPQLIGTSVRRLVAWRQQNSLDPSVSATFNIHYDDPISTPPEDYRLDLCAAVAAGVAENALGFVEKTIPGGRCAVLRHVGSDDTLGEAVRYLTSTWLETSGEERRDFPLFMQRVRCFPEVPEEAAITDVLLPLR